MREDWISDIFSNCIKLKSGDGLTAKKMIPGEIPVYGGNGIAGYHSESNLNGSQIIIGRVGALCGRVRYLNEEIWLTDNAFKISEYKYDFDPKFLTYLLNHLDLRSFARQAAQPVISNSSLKHVLLTFPESVTEQKAIVKILDEAFAKIDQAKANIEKNIENAKELFQSKLNEIFSQGGEGWEEKELGGIGYLKSGGTPSRTMKEYWNESSIPWYASGELNETFTKQSKRHITQLGLHNSNAKIFPKGSLLIGMYDTAALKMSIIDRDATFNQAIVGVEPNDKIDLIFIMHSINSQREEILSLRRGVRQKNLNQSKIKAIKIQLPDISVQQQVVISLEKLRERTFELEKQFRVKLNNLEELKKSLLQKAFSGELTKMSEP